MSGHHPWPPPERERYWYPRFVGGSMAKKRAPYGHLNHVQIMNQPLTLPQYVSEKYPPPPESLAVRTETYTRQKVRMGDNRVLEFWAYSSLPGEDAADQLFADMLSRCGAKQVKP